MRFKPLKSAFFDLSDDELKEIRVKFISYLYYSKFSFLLIFIYLYYILSFSFLFFIFYDMIYIIDTLYITSYWLVSIN